MSIAWATIVVVVLLLPGFAFLWGFYSPNAVNRESVQASPLGQLAVVVAISFFTHAVIYVFLNWLPVCSSKFTFAPPCVDLDLLAAVLRAEVVWPGSVTIPWGSRIDTYAGQILLYFVVSILLCGSLGRYAGVQLVRGRLSFLARHHYLFMLEGGLKAAATEVPAVGAALVRAHVLSSTAHDGLRLIYDGVLSDFFAKSDGTVRYLVLRGANCGVFQVDPFKPRRVGTTVALDTAVEDDPAGRFMSAGQSVSTAILVLHAEQIENVYFEHLSVVEVNPDDQQKLDAGIEEVEKEDAR